MSFKKTLPLLAGVGLGKPSVRQNNSFTLITSSLAINILSLALPIMTLQVYDRILARHGFGTLAVLVIAVTAIIIMEMVMRIARSYIISWSGAVYEHTRGCEAVDHVLHADILAAAEKDAGEHVQDLAAISRLKDCYSGEVITALMDIPFVLIFLGLIAYLGGAVVIAPLMLMVLFTAFAWAEGAKLREALFIREKNDDRRFNFIIEALQGIHTIKSLGLEALFQRRYEHLQYRGSYVNYRVAESSGAAANMGSIFSQIMVIVVMAAGAPLVVYGGLSTGALIACVLLSGRIMQPMQRALGMWTQFQDYRLAKQRMNSLFALPRMKESTTEFTEKRGRVHCKDVVFGFHPEISVLKGVSLVLEPGECIAITGSRSSGKSTLMQLIAGMYAPKKGQVQIDGIEPYLFRSEELVRHVGYMPTYGMIFQGTILENLTGFRPEKRKRAIEVAELLGIDVAVARMPKGYETYLEAATADIISPGLKQRIAMARVLLDKPRVLLFDNADRTLDKDAYNHVFRLLGRLKGKVTIILVSDDRNLLRLADKEFTLRRGKLLENMRWQDSKHYTPKEPREIRV